MQHQFLLNDRGPSADSASGCQTHGSNGVAAVWNPDSFAWSDQDWRGVPLEELVLYEVHVGTFTTEGTFDAVIPRLPALRDLGITALELMSVGEAADPNCRCLDEIHSSVVRQHHGGPHGLQRLVGACHAHGMAVIADLAQDALGCGTHESGETTAGEVDQHRTGSASSRFDPTASQSLRTSSLDGLRDWIRHFHLDGLRLNLLDSDLDPREREKLVEIQQIAAETRTQTGRRVHVMAHSPRHDVGFLDSQRDGGCGLDAIWNEDFHHCFHVLLTGDRGTSYADFTDPRRQIMKALNQTFVFDGFCSHLRGKPYTSPAGGHDGRHFVVSLQDSAHLTRRIGGTRLSTRIGPAPLRLAAGLMLMAPHIPLIFMGDEYGEERPFFQCTEAVAANPSKASAGALSEDLPSPCEDRPAADAPAAQSSLTSTIAWQWNDGSPQAGLRRLYADLLTLRRTLPPLRDFRNRTARIIPVRDGLSFLHLARGDGDTSFGTVHVWFNWNDRELPLPGRLSDRSPPLLTSESPQYGGARDPRSAVTSLAPYEFAIYGT
jgi:maltooligosyltrehalose trehalohydrolase